MIIAAFLAFFLIGKLIEASMHRKRLAALEKEQQRQARTQMTLIREQQRQAEQIRKHEEQIAKLEYRMAEAEADIETQTNRIAQLYALLDVAEAAQVAAVPGSVSDERAQRKIISLESQITAAEKKLRKAKFDHASAKAKLSA